MKAAVAKAKAKAKSPSGKPDAERLAKLARIEAAIAAIDPRVKLIDNTGKVFFGASAPAEEGNPALFEITYAGVCFGVGPTPEAALEDMRLRQAHGRL